MNIMARMKKPLSSYTRKNDMVSGKEVLSSALPIFSHDGAGISVRDGKLVKGVLAKGGLAAASNGLFHVVYNDFSHERCGQLINDFQNLVTA